MRICDFPGSVEIGKPRDWDNELDGHCGSIFVTNSIDPVSGHNFMYSVYKPSADEIAALAAGGVFRLGIAGRTHPVFNLNILSHELVKDIGLVEKGDLGGVITVDTPDPHG